MSTETLHLDLRELSLRGGESFERTYAVDLAPIVVGGQSYQTLLPDGVTVAVDRVAGGFLVAVSLTVSVYGPCERCLRETTLCLQTEEQEFAPTTQEAWDESELSPFIADLVVDIAGLAREAAVLALPGQIVCSPDCRGLCPTCGQDLNTGPCACPPPTGDERWSVLQHLRAGQ